MAANNAFNLTGALGNIIGTPGSTLLKPITSGINSLFNSKPATPAYNPSQNMSLYTPPQPKPDTSLKQSSITHPDGTTITNTYHPPTTGTNTNSSSAPKTGVFNGNTYNVDSSGVPYGAPISLASNQQNNQSSGLINNSNQNTPPPTPTFPGLITQLSNQQSSPNNKIISDAAQNISNISGTNMGTSGQAYQDYQQAVSDLNTLKENIARQTGELQATGAPLSFQQGKLQVTNQQNAALLNAAQQKVNEKAAALGYGITGQQAQLAGFNQAGQLGVQGQTLAQSALNSAAGYAQPQLGQYGQTYYNPLTQGQGGGNNLQPTGVVANDINTFSQAVANGQMDYATALSQLSGYGTAVQNQLLPAIQKLQPNFNVSQSQTLAAQQGSIGPAYQYAKTAMVNLQNAVGNLNFSQNTNIPIINQITQGASTMFGVGSEAVQAYKGALAEARSAIQKVLASVQGGTPTDYVGQSNALLPDNATPNQIAAAAQTLDTLGTAKVNIYGNPGAATNASGGSTNISNGNTISTPYGNINPNL